MRRLITTLTLTLTAFSVSFGQNFRKDIESGLYFSSPVWIQVHQLVSDTLKSFKLIESRYHYNKVTMVLYDSVPKRKLYEPRKSERGSGKITDILKIDKSQYSIIYTTDKGFNSVNYIKRDIGYEMYFSRHEVKREDLVKSIKHDTTTYLKFCSFTLSDIKKLRKLKNLNDINQTDFESLMAYIDKYKTDYLEKVRKSKTRSLYGTVETNEMLVKVLLELKYNPLIMPGDFDRLYKKYRPKR